MVKPWTTPVGLDPRRLMQAYRDRYPQIVAAWSNLDAREDECWRMFGITVEYVMDERVVITGNS
jgi:hypothetical protein